MEKWYKIAKKKSAKSNPTILKSY